MPQRGTVTAVDATGSLEVVGVKAPRLRALPRTWAGPDGQRVAGVVLLVSGRPATKLTHAQAAALADRLIDAAEAAERKVASDA